MSLEEAERIACTPLPGERADALTNWRGSMPPAEPMKAQQRLDTAPEVDWSAIIHQVAKTERGLLTEAMGQAIGDVRNEVLDEFEAAIAELRTEMRREVDQLRAEFSQAREIATLRTELAEIKALLMARTRTKAAPAQPPAQVPAPSEALPLADASLAPRTNGDGRA
jgi:hypothetical protein